MEDNTDTDASPEPPRPEGPNEVHPAEIQDNENQQGHPYQVDIDYRQGQNHANEEETCAATRSVLSDVYPPHQNWPYNTLLIDISKALTEDDLKKMKFMYRDEIGSKALEKITDAVSLFVLMEKRMDLSSINLLQLCSLLFIVDRYDLIRQVAEYSRKTENALYMYIDKPTHSLVTGYKQVQFHVVGRDFSKTTKKDIIDFRKNVATLLSVEERYVKIDDVTPSSSIDISILLRERDVTALQNILEAKDSIDSKARLVLLIFYGVDTVIIGAKTFRIQEAMPASLADDEQMQLDMHQQLQKAKHTIAETELENLILKHKVRQLQAENTENTPIHYVKQDYLSPDAGEGDSQDKSKQLLTDDIKTALENFKVSLAKMTDAKYDEQLVLKLLQAHGTLVASGCYHEMPSIFVKSNMPPMNIFYDKVVAETHCDFDQIMGTFNWNQVVRALREISARVTPEEKQKLQKEYQWTEDDKEFEDKEAVPFFFTLLHKEHEKVGGDEVDLKDFLQECLTKIDRLNLLQVFFEELRIPVKTEHSQQLTKGRETSTGKHEVKEQTLDELMKNAKPLIDQVDKNSEWRAIYRCIPSKA